MAPRPQSTSNNQWIIILAIVVGVLVVGVIAVVAVAAILLVNRASSPARVPIVETSPKARALVDRNSMGDPNSPVKIVEYSDFQCVYCKRFADETEQAIIDNYVATGKVYYTFRSMGNFVSGNLGQENTESLDAAMAAYCAADQGKFWEYKDSLFANFKGENAGSFTQNSLTAMAKSIGLDVDQFSECLKSGKYSDQVNQDGQDGQAAGLTGVPAFFINGKLVMGAQPYATFQQEIDASLKAAGQ
jgi:protein-disulfide isomerase